MEARRDSKSLTAGALVLCFCVALAVMAMSSPALAIKRGAESINCGGTSSQSTSYRAHDTIAQCPIGPVAEGTGLRAYDGFWLTLPNINVLVEGMVFAELTEAGDPVVRWTVGSLGGLVGFNVYRSTSEEGPFELLNEQPLQPQSPGAFTDTSAWPQSTFWYEVRAVSPDGSEEPVLGSPASVTTEGRLVLRLHPVRPNPMSDVATVCFDVPDHVGSVRLAFYNVRGQCVRTLVDDTLGRGRHDRTWNCTDDRGRQLASGVYFARLSVDGRTDDQKVMVLR